MYYHQKLDQKKIPTPLALLSLLLIIFVIPFAYKKPGPTTSKAQNIKYDRLQISNLTQQSVTISWSTPDKQSAWILYGHDSTKLSQTALDERDLGDKRGEYNNHYISLTGLEPNKNYFYKIVTSKGVIADGNKPFRISTAGQFGLTNNKGPSFGKIMRANGTPAEAIVFLTIEGAIPLSSRTKETTGEFLIPMYYLLKNPGTIFNPKPDTPVTFKILSENGDTSTVKTTFDKIGPLDQTVILGKDYDFLNPKDQVLSETIKTEEPLKRIDIIFPGNNAAIPGNKPLYKGVGIPGSKVFISLLPNTYDLQTVTDKDGIWKASSNTPLNPGTYTMKVNTTDEQNKPVSLNRTFTIEKSGEAVLGEATGSATLTPTKTIAPKITSSPQATPTTAVVATETPQPTYPVTTSVTITPAPTLPETGINYMAFSMLSVALIIIGAGMILIF